MANMQFSLRVRHRDDSGDVATEWTPWTTLSFSTGVAGVKDALLLEVIDDLPAPRWCDSFGIAIELPVGAPQPMLRVENDLRWLLLRVDGDPAPGNVVTNPPAVPLHRAVRVGIKLGNGGNMMLPEKRVVGL